MIVKINSCWVDIRIVYSCLFVGRLGAVEKQATTAAEEKSRLASELNTKEAALAAAMNKKPADYDAGEVRELEVQVGEAHDLIK